VWLGELATSPRVYVPRHTYYLSTKDLGLGLLSLEDAARLDAIKIDYQCLTDSNPSLPIHRTHSLTQRIVEADWDRHHQDTQSGKRGSGTLCHDLAQAREELSISVTKTPIVHSPPWVTGQDAARTRECTPLPHTYVYTDGSQADEGNTPTAGYGFVTFRADSPPLPVFEVSERLPGDQFNFSAESMAILHGLLTHHPETPLTFFVDNHAAIERTNQDDCNLPRTRSNRPARAIWNRVAACLRDRTGPTAFRWVHSHPKDSPRSTKVSASGLV
jgi:ribonuclease HI